MFQRGRQHGVHSKVGDSVFMYDFVLVTKIKLPSQVCRKIHRVNKKTDIFNENSC